MLNLLIATSYTSIGFGNPIFDAVVVSIILGILAMIRNSLVEVEALHSSHAFVGSDLVLSFYGVGLILLIGVLYGHLTIPHDSLKDPWAGAAKVFAATVPLLFLAIGVERVVHTRVLNPALSTLLWMVNIGIGAVPLGYAAVHFSSLAG